MVWFVVCLIKHGWNEMKQQERDYYKNDFQEVENLIRESKNRIQKEIKKGFKFHHLTYTLSNHI